MKTTASLKRPIFLAFLGGSIAASNAVAGVAAFDSASRTVRIDAVDLVNGEGTIKTWNATLALKQSSPDIELELVNAAPVTTPAGDRAYFDRDTNTVFIPSVQVGPNEFAATLELIPGSTPLRFRVDRLHQTQFGGCPSFAQPIGQDACLLQGEIKQDVALTNDTTWVLSGGVFFGGDKTDSVSVTIEPGTKIMGQQSGDFFYVRRGSKIKAVGSPSDPIVFTGPLEQTPGEWGGVVIAGNAPVNGCNEGVALCEQQDEAMLTPYGGNDVNDDSGIMKFTQIRWAGFPVRPDQELNGLTLLGVGAGTTVDYIEIFEGQDDGIEFFGGTAQVKHLVLVNNHDDSLDWGQGWRGKVQFALVKQDDADADRCIEADNNEDNFDSQPRSKPEISNLLCQGGATASQGAELRRGTGANIHNSVFVNSPSACIRISDEATFVNAGSPGNLTGELTIDHSYAFNCEFVDGDGSTFSVAEWFNSQEGNVQGDPQLEGYLPADISPLLTGGVTPSDSFFTQVSYIGPFKDKNSDWTKGWTVGLQ